MSVCEVTRWEVGGHEGLVVKREVMSMCKVMRWEVGGHEG